MSSKVLVTGAAGLFGANFCKYLCDKGYEVIGIDNMSGGYKEFVDRRVELYYWDLKDGFSVDEVFETHKPEYVFHFAAYAACGLSPFIRNFNYTNNILASANLINSSINHDVKKFIFTSSMTVYGANTPPFTEDMPYNPSDPYAIAKMAVELDLKDAKERHGLDYSVVRPHNVHGIYQNIWDRYRNVIGIFIRKAIAKENLVVYGDGSQIRAFSDIKYYMEPMEKLMFEHSGETFNLGTDETTTIMELARLVQKVSYDMGHRVDIVHAEPRNEVHTAYCDHTKAKKMLGFSDKTDLEQLVRNMYVWAQSQPNRKVKNLKPELTKGLYSYWK